MQEIANTWEKCIIIVLFSYISLTNLNSFTFAADDDPTGYLKILLCRAELSLNNNNYTEAERLADTVVSKAFDGPKNWRRGNLLHHGFRILGMVSLKNGKLEAAKDHLINSAITHSGSPQLNSFGPNMSLAKALLESGEKDIVLKYIDLCKRFWPREKLSRWSAEIIDGKIPDFGANLVYGIDLPGSHSCPTDIK